MIAAKKSTLREKQVEERLRVKTLKILKGIAYKFKSPARRSVPDRLLVWPLENFVFVECKAPGKTWTKAQAKHRDMLRRMGFKVFIVDTYEAVDELIEILSLL